MVVVGGGGGGGAHWMNPQSDLLITVYPIADNTVVPFVPMSNSKYVNSAKAKTSVHIYTTRNRRSSKPPYCEMPSCVIK